ncbi:MAG: hypothetical protein P8098_06015, partial [Candidatus Thiodiazotropha sp.]
ALSVLRPDAIKSLDAEHRRYVASEAVQTPMPASDFYALGVLLYQLVFNPDLHDSSDADAPEKWSFKGEHRDLEPLLRQLLDSDPAYRIRNLDQFNRALRQCGVQLPGSPRSVAKAKLSPGSGTEAETTAR